MLQPSPLVRVVALAGALGVLACGKAPFAIPESDHSALQISPAGSTIETGVNLQLYASVAEGSARGIAPDLVRWTSSAPNIVAVTPHGMAIGLAAGQADITGEFGGFSAVSTISVIRPARNCAPGQLVPIQC